MQRHNANRDAHPPSDEAGLAPTNEPHFYFRNKVKQISSAPSILVSWQPRGEPLAPIGVAACGEAARVLARRLLQRDDEALQKLEGISAGEWLLFRGATENLPWADGAIYLGRDAAAPTLLLPTLWRSAPDAALLQRALKSHFESGATLALVPPCAHRDAAPGSTNETRESVSDSPQEAEIAPSPNAPRVLAHAPTLVFSLESARRIARAPLENWLRAQGEEPPIAPSVKRPQNAENDAVENTLSSEISPIGDPRFSANGSQKNDVENARDLEENR